MRIKLFNFLCWDSYECDLGSSGLTLIAGPSGQGKSSILRAINFVLTGEGTKLASYTGQKKKVQVDLWHENVHIMRSKCPNRLVVTTPEGSYEDIHAESILKTYFPANFSVCGYIKQKSANSFLSMTPSSKLEYLEQMALGDEVEEIKKNTSALLSQKKTQHDSLMAVLEYMRSEYHRMPTPPPSSESSAVIKEAIDAWTIRAKELSDKIESKRQLQMKLEQKIMTQQQIDMVRKELASTVVPEKPQLDEEAKSKLKTLKDLSVHVKMYTEYKTLEREYTEVLQVQREKLEAQIAAIGETTDTQPLIKEGEERERRNQRRDQYEKLLAQYSGKPVDIGELDNRLKTVRETVSRIELEKTLLECPDCGSHVRMTGGKLVKYELQHPQHLSDSDLVSLRGEEKSLGQMIEKARKDESMRTMYAKEVESLGPREEVPDLPSLRAALAKHVQKAQVQQELRTLEDREYFRHARARLNSKRCNPPVTDLSVEEIDAQIARLTLHLSDYEKYLKQYTVQVAKRQELENRLAKLDVTVLEPPVTYEMIDQVKKEISFAQQQKTTNESVLTDCRHSLQAAIVYENWLERKTKAEADLKTKETEYSCVQKEYTDIQRFKSVLSKAEGIAVSSLIDEINTHLKGYLDVFFQDNPITVAVDTERETKKGEKRSQVCIKVGYKGTDTDLNTLSGGERDRVDLAFTLALSEIFDSPLVLLDESLSSLDAVSSETVLSHLQEKDRLYVIVAHQVPHGIFEKSILIG